MAEEKARATFHAAVKGKGGRPVGSSRHNFREFPEKTKEPGASKIDRGLTQYNKYMLGGRYFSDREYRGIIAASANDFAKQAFRFRHNQKYDSLTTSQRLELFAYEKLLKSGIEGQHRRNESRRQGHLNRDALDIMLSNKTCPEESILQIGNRDYCPVTAAELWGIYNDYVAMHNAKYGQHIKILDAVMHVDEPTGTPHIHERKAYLGVNKYGESCIGKDSALAQLGIKRPDMTKAAGRRNNRKQTYTKDCREMWLQVCRQHGLDLETEPRVYADPHGLELTEYKTKQEQARLAKLQEQTQIVMEKQTQTVQNFRAHRKAWEEWTAENPSKLEDLAAYKMAVEQYAPDFAKDIDNLLYWEGTNPEYWPEDLYAEERDNPDPDYDDPEL